MVGSGRLTGRWANQSGADSKTVTIHGQPGCICFIPLSDGLSHKVLCCPAMLTMHWRCTDAQLTCIDTVLIILNAVYSVSMCSDSWTINSVSKMYNLIGWKNLVVVRRQKHRFYAFHFKALVSPFIPGIDIIYNTIQDIWIHELIGYSWLNVIEFMETVWWRIPHLLAINIHFYLPYRFQEKIYSVCKL